MAAVVLTLRMLVGLIFLLAGYLKLRHPGPFVDSLLTSGAEHTKLRSGNMK
jgi:hypothetical protein